VTEDDISLLAWVRAVARDGRARAMRLAAAVSQAEVGSACGVAATTISLWESGKRAPHGGPALRYAAILSRLKNDEKRRVA
jgi:transcriptional regulator with XRE-family HTH domain